MNKWVKRALTALQIGGGLVGLGIITQVLRHVEQTPASLIIHACFAALFAFGIAAGVLLIIKPRLGAYLSLVFQFIQIPIITTSAAAYAMFSGATFHIYAGPAEFGTYLHLGGQYRFWLNPDGPWLVGVNFIALFFFIYLVRHLWLDRTPAQTPQDSRFEAPIAEAPPAEGRLDWRTS
jgi:hypothetical protein